MLDTNTVSHFLRQHTEVTRRVLATPMDNLCISAITEGELRFGLAKRPEAKRLHLIVNEFLIRVETLAWDSYVSKIYGQLRSELTQQGKLLAPLDLLIASHAAHANATLVTNDRAFSQVKSLQVEDWTL